MQEKAADSGAQRAAHFFRCRTDLGIFVGAAERRRWALRTGMVGTTSTATGKTERYEYEGRMGR